MREYYVYIMTNRSRTLYIGVTHDLQQRRVHEHQHKLLQGFTSRYSLDRLIYFEVASDPRAAIAREKQLKGWTRAKKIALIESQNSCWSDLSS